MNEICKELNCSISQLALAWILYNKNTSTVIIGASSKEQIYENVKSIEVVKKLNENYIKKIENAL